MEPTDAITKCSQVALARETIQDAVELYDAVAAGLEQLQEQLPAEIKGQEDLAVATNCAKQAKEAQKLIKECTKELEAPFDAILKRLGEVWAPLLRGLKIVEEKARAASVRFYEAEQRRQREEQARKERERREAEQKMAAARAAEKASGRTVETVQQNAEALRTLADVSAPTQQAIRASRTDQATLAFTSRWSYELVDLAKVPDEFTTRVLDKQAIRAALSSGCREIPGLRIFEEKGTSLR